MTLELGGIHHLTAVTADAPRNLKFYTETLGMRLIKKTVNQDDTSAYHLFYGDGVASPGADLTFFDFPTMREQRGNHTVGRTGLRVDSEETLKGASRSQQGFHKRHQGTLWPCLDGFRGF
jgi:glyoxalase family protein